LGGKGGKPEKMVKGRGGQQPGSPFIEGQTVLGEEKKNKKEEYRHMESLRKEMLNGRKGNQTDWIRLKLAYKEPAENRGDPLDVNG